MYWHELQYEAQIKKFRLFERAVTQEIDPPFRYGVGLAIRKPFSRKAVVIGAWVSKRNTESEALTYAIRGRYVPGAEMDWDKLRLDEISGAIEDVKQKK